MIIIIIITIITASAVVAPFVSYVAFAIALEPALALALALDC